MTNPLNEVRGLIALKYREDELTIGEVLSQAQFLGQLGFISQLTDILIIRNEAKAAGLRISNEELQEAADTFRTQRDLLKAADLLAWLKERHLSIAAWETGLEDQLISRKVRAHIAAEHIDQYFARHILDFERAEISQIMVNDESLAFELRAQIVEEDADFHALARIHSIDSTSRPRGGYLGFIRRADLSSAAEAAVFGSTAGAIKGPFKIESGWQLIKVESSSSANLDSDTSNAIAETLFEEWLSQKRLTTSVEIPFYDLLTEDDA